MRDDLNNKLVAILVQMIDLDPAKRPNITEIQDCLIEIDIDLLNSESDSNILV